MEGRARTGTGWLLAAALTVAGVTGAAAQERPGAVYVHGGVTIAQQDGAAGVRIGGSRFAVAPAFRVRAVTRSEDLMAYYPGGLPGWSIGGGVAVRVVF